MHMLITYAHVGHSRLCSYYWFTDLDDNPISLSLTTERHQKGFLISNGIGRDKTALVWTQLPKPFLLHILISLLPISADTSYNPAATV